MIVKLDNRIHFDGYKNKEGAKAKTGWLGIRIMCSSGSICLLFQ
jgi:hypothetical protein